MIFILALLVLSVNKIHAQYTSIPDPNFEAYLEDNGMGDGIPGNGQVLTANIENVTELVLPNFNNIIEVVGIEDFLSLEIFEAGFNPISSINLSQNINLLELGVGYTNITTLDLSNNNQLVYLGCIGNTQLTSIIATSTYLEVIHAWENNLSSIDITNCTAIKEIWVESNNLTEIDLSNNLELIFLSCEFNSLNLLNTTQNPLLEFLSASFNSFSSLDLSQNTNLNYVALGFNNQLNYIDIRNGNNEDVSSFSTYSNPSLDCIFVDDSSASYLEDWTVDPHTNFVNNEQECEAISVEEYQKPLFSMYPNPAKEHITVISENSGIYTLSSSQGNMVADGIIAIGFNRIGISELNAGIYFLEVETIQGKEVKRVVKE